MAIDIINEVKNLHPYFPIGIAFSGDVYTANDWDVLTLILVFAGGWAGIFFMTLVGVRMVNPHLKGANQLLVLWFVLSKFFTQSISYLEIFLDEMLCGGCGCGCRCMVVLILM